MQIGIGELMHGFKILVYKVYSFQGVGRVATIIDGSTLRHSFMSVFVLGLFFYTYLRI